MSEPRAHARTHILLLVQDLNVRIVDAATGELLRELTINPDNDYQGAGAPGTTTRSTPEMTKPDPIVGPACPGSLERSHDRRLRGTSLTCIYAGCSVRRPELHGGRVTSGSPVRHRS